MRSERAEAVAERVPDSASAAAPARLRVRDLCVSFRTRHGLVAALSDVTLEVAAGEFFLVVGESGSGKSVLAHALLGVLPANVNVSGSVLLDGIELMGSEPKQLRARRARDFAFIPQSPVTALNPVRRLGTLMAESARAKGVPNDQVRTRLVAATRDLGLEFDHLERRYAHQLSGGMQQRVVTAMAAVAHPKVVIADEPTSSLDADLVADTATQLRRLADGGAAVIVITHDLRLAAHLGGRLALTYAGRIVEERPTPAFFTGPAHHYGRGLLGALPERDAVPIPGSSPVLTDLPQGCAFAPRCGYADDPCRDRLPDAEELADGFVRCVHHARG